MRFYVVVILIIFIGFGCRSSKHSDVSLDDQSQITENTTISKTDSSASTTMEQSKNQTIDWETQYLRITNFDSLGRISQIQESWRGVGHGQLDESSRGSANVSVKSQKADSSRSIKKDLKFTEAKHAVTDSRILQDSEWLYLGIACILIIAVVFFYLKYIRK